MNDCICNLEPNSKYSKIHDEEEKTCPICFEEMKKEINYTVTICGHEFHSSCLFHSYDVKESCPLCRKILSTKKDKKKEDEHEYEIMSLSFSTYEREEQENETTERDEEFERFFLLSMREEMNIMGLHEEEILLEN